MFKFLTYQDIEFAIEVNNTDDNVYLQDFPFPFILQTKKR